jgi:hypothetical protein
VSYVNDAYDHSVAEDPVNHRNSPRRAGVATRELIAQRLANAVRIVCQRAADERPARDGH